MHRRLLAAGSALLVAALAAGCTTKPTAPAASPSTPAASSAPPRQVFDPPTRFDAAGTPLGAARPTDVLLHRGTAFVAGATATTVTDVLTGRQVGVLTPKHQAITRDQVVGQPVGHTPLLVEHGGQPAVVVPYAVNVPASGTTTARQAVDLVVADASTGTAIATVGVDAAPAEGDFAAVAGEYTTLVGARGNIVVLTIGKQVTVAVDLATGATLWRKNDVRAAAVLGDTVIGLTSPNGSFQQSVIGLGITDGAKRWSAADVRNADLVPGGPAFVVLIAEQTNGKRFYALVHADGTLTNRTDGDYGSGLRCWYDAKAVTICAVGTSQLFALDASTGKDLWQLPATGRTAPTVTAVWHGAVYGTVAGKPVVLDAHTGTDKETAPGLAPVAVGGYAGVAAATQAGPPALLAHPAIG